MIFAKLEYSEPFEEMHDELCSLMRSHFSDVEAGRQSDSWIWIHAGAHKVAVDTFTSITHEVKSACPGKHVDDVISALKQEFSVVVLNEPEWEGHEDRND